MQIRNNIIIIQIFLLIKSTKTSNKFYIYIYQRYVHFDFNILHGASVYLCGNLRDLVNDTIFIFILKLSKFSNDSKMG